MTAIRAAVRRRLARRSDGDAGFSLIESLIAMVIFSIFMGIATGAIVSIMQSTQKTQNLTNSATEVENAFQTLDHQVRYSDAISQTSDQDASAFVNNSYYVEFHQQATSTSVEMCYQLKYDQTAKTLLERSWKPKASPVVASPWKLLAHTLLPPPSSPAPFLQTPAGNKNAAGEVLNAHQQLAVTVTVRASSGKTAEGSTLTANFTALNSTTTSGITCQEVGRT